MEQNIVIVQVFVVCLNWDKLCLVFCIVYLGCGVFYCVYQVFFIYYLLEKSDSDWGICEVNLMLGNDVWLIVNLKV